MFPLRKRRTKLYRLKRSIYFKTHPHRAQELRRYEQLSYLAIATAALCVVIIVMRSCYVAFNMRSAPALEMTVPSRQMSPRRQRTRRYDEDDYIWEYGSDRGDVVLSRRKGNIWTTIIVWAIMVIIVAALFHRYYLRTLDNPMFNANYNPKIVMPAFVSNRHCCKKYRAQKRRNRRYSTNNYNYAVPFKP